MVAEQVEQIDLIDLFADMCKVQDEGNPVAGMGELANPYKIQYENFLGLRVEVEEAKIIFHFVRHGEVLFLLIAYLEALAKSYKAGHNIYIPDCKDLLYCTRECKEHRHGLRDLCLTGKGEEQIAALSQRFHHMDNITHIVCSPMRRTLDIAPLSFTPLFVRGLVMHVFEQLKELGNSPSATGSAQERLKTI